MLSAVGFGSYYNVRGEFAVAFYRPAHYCVSVVARGTARQPVVVVVAGGGGGSRHAARGAVLGAHLLAALHRERIFATFTET